MKLLILLLLLLAAPDLGSAARCSVAAVPKVSNEPLRYVRVRVIVERDPGVGRITLAMFGPAGLVRSSQLWERGWVEAPRSFQVEWKDIYEGAGEYVVIVQAEGSATCRASDRLIVA
jgi:hypothetical protein